MNLRSLVLSSDEKVVRVLRRVLSDLEIGVEHCADADSAIRKLTRQRFEAVIVDGAEPGAAQVLGSARCSAGNKRAVAVAIVDTSIALGRAFERGAHFVLYQPLSAERARSSFRAAKALMKRERRRNARVVVEIPVTVKANDIQEQARTLDLGEGGAALKFSEPPQNLSSLWVHFHLPGTPHHVECVCEVAWESGDRQMGIRFVDLLPETRDQLKAWLEQHSPEFEKDDPPAACKITDLSAGGCYLEVDSPFPVRTRVVLSCQTGGLRVQAEGVVQVMHPEQGMGVEFTQRTAPQKERVKKFIQALISPGHAQRIAPQLLVEPEGLDADEPVLSHLASRGAQDPLLELFRRKAELPPEVFLAELRRRRNSKRESPLSNASV